MLTSFAATVTSKLESWGIGTNSNRMPCMSSQLEEEIPRDLSIGLSRIYHNAPNDIMELIVRLLSDVKEDRWGMGPIPHPMGGLNGLRLVSKRLKRMVDACTTWLTQPRTLNGPEALPRSILMRCKRIEHIRCDSSRLRSLEGCPDGLKSLGISGCLIQSLEPLRRCTQLDSLTICHAERIIDLSPLSFCPRLKILTLLYSPITDLSPLSSLTLLEDLSIMGCMNVTSLDPLSGLMNLQKICCRGIDPQTSLLPLASCTGLKDLSCNFNAVDRQELQKRIPGVTMTC